MVSGISIRITKFYFGFQINKNCLSYLFDNNWKTVFFIYHYYYNYSRFNEFIYNITSSHPTYYHFSYAMFICLLLVYNYYDKSLNFQVDLFVGLFCYFTAPVQSISLDGNL